MLLVNDFYHTCVTHCAYFSNSFWRVLTLSDSSRSSRFRSSIRLFWVVSCRSILLTFCSRSCTREHTLSEVTGALPPMAVVLVPLFVADSAAVVFPVMWIVLVLRVMGVGDMLRLRRFTLTGRLLALLVLVGAASFVPLLLAALSDDEMAILVERADIDLVITLLVVVLVLLLLCVLLECSTLLLVNEC